VINRPLLQLQRRIDPWQAELYLRDVPLKLSQQMCRKIGKTEMLAWLGKVFSDLFK
jgi:hypothetical protein